MRSTQRKGDTAAAQALATFTRLGYDVSIPFTESASYDLIVDVDGQLSRVQVKYCGSKNNEVGLRRVSTNSKGHVYQVYTEGSYDWLYVLRSDGKEYLFTESLAGRKSIRAQREEDELANVLGGLAERTNATSLNLVEA